MSKVEEKESPQGSPAHSIQDNDNDALSDKDSDILSEIDENQFEDYDPTTAPIEERPVEIDEDIAKSLKASKRKRLDGETSKKPKGGRREKKRRTDDEVSADGEILEGGRRRKTRDNEGAERRAREKVSPEPQNEEDLSPEERRRRALDRAMDAAIKGPAKRRRKKDEVDLEDEADEQIAELKIRMENACVADNEAREKGQPAISKLKLLPRVVGLLNRNNIQHAILDPETNFLQSVKYFLEPLNDGSLPAYNIQREIFTALTRLPIEKETLLSSGIGKVVLFYTRSKRPQAEIKRMAERLLGEWSRPILKRTDDYKKRHVETRDFDYAAAKLARQAGLGQIPHRPAGSQTRADIERQRLLAPITNPNRARPVGLPAAYTVAPRSTFDAQSRGSDFRPIGAAGADAFRRMTQKGKKKS
ncbi:Transcription factor IWS1 [Pleurostoma richardsiae]|uniref:Transcription factor IWS1 n=1 Tax=Pleurostoma richardsiae TaxID=41990 RepID=A0AA38RCA2_9PEZI|nr:Transcription factor IWS1 [Pleurostoma richardsiae]